MQAFLEFVGKWIDLIVEFFGNYPLVAAIITVIAVGVYILLWKKLHIDTWTMHTLLFLCVILGWAVAIPILGSLVIVIEFIGKGIAWIYKKYESHPIFCISVTGIMSASGTVWYLLPKRWKPMRFIRIVITLLIWFLLIALIVPVLDIL